MVEIRTVVASGGRLRDELEKTFLGDGSVLCLDLAVACLHLSKLIELHT